MVPVGSGATALPTRVEELEECRATVVLELALVTIGGVETLDRCGSSIQAITVGATMAPGSGRLGFDKGHESSASAGIMLYLPPRPEEGGVDSTGKPCNEALVDA